MIANGVTPRARLLFSLLLVALLITPILAVPAPDPEPQVVVTVTITEEPVTVTAGVNQVNGAVVTQQAKAASGSSQFTDAALFKSIILNTTNTYRAHYNAADVVWNDTLASYTAGYFDKASCSYQHSGGPYGENMGMGCSEAQGCVEMWGNEASSYDYNNPGFSKSTGHFTQLVWKSTTAVGCGAYMCANGGGSPPAYPGWWLICEYWPPGNYLGEFANEVDRPVANGGGHTAASSTLEDSTSTVKLTSTTTSTSTKTRTTTTISKGASTTTSTRPAAANGAATSDSNADPSMTGAPTGPHTWTGTGSWTGTGNWPGPGNWHGSESWFGSWAGTGGWPHGHHDTGTAPPSGQPTATNT